MWWRFVHEAAEDTQPPAPADGNGAPAQTAAGTETGAVAEQRRAPEPAGAGRRPRTSTTRSTEDAELAAYNEYLAQLAERDKAAGR